jgi:hypothetical protein
MSTDEEVNAGVIGKRLNLAVSKLLLDVENPRFGSKNKSESQEDLAVKMEMSFDIITVAESIARNGFFANEPLIVVSGPAKGMYTVIEGNRRLTALIALTDVQTRSKMYQVDRLDELAKISLFQKSNSVPCTLVESRAHIAPILGFRHISGILEWQPFAQAKFIAKLIDQEKYDFKSAAEAVGKEKNQVAEMYRNQAIAQQAADVGMNTTALEASFSVLQVAMGSPGIRSFIGAPLGSAVTVGVKPIPEHGMKSLRELLGFLFGEDQRAPVIKDTRQISKLGKIIQSDIGLKTLRETWSLEAAEESIKDVAMDPYTRLLNRLKTATESVKSTFDDVADYVDDKQVQISVQALHEHTSNLKDLVADD